MHDNYRALYTKLIKNDGNSSFTVTVILNIKAVVKILVLFPANTLYYIPLL